MEFVTCEQCYPDRHVKSIFGIFACWVRLNYWNSWMVFWLLNHIENCILSLFPWCWTLKSYLFCICLTGTPCVMGRNVWSENVSGSGTDFKQMRLMWCEFILWQCLLAIKLDSDDHTDEESELVQPQEVDPSRGEMQEGQWIAQLRKICQL